MSTDRYESEYLATMELLNEALEYLLRLPPHPMTRSLARKIQEHVEEPARRVEFQRRQRAAGELVGSNFTAAGLPVIRAVLSGAELVLTAPVLSSSGGEREMGAFVLQRLKQGERILMQARRTASDAA